MLIIPYINVNSFSRISNALRFSIPNDILSNVSITLYLLFQPAYVDILSSRKNIKLELKLECISYLLSKLENTLNSDILNFVASKNIFKVIFIESQILMVLM